MTKMKCKDIINQMRTLAPENLAMSWDNTGFMVGDLDSDVQKILLALDITDDVVEEAMQKSANLIITHHPVLYKDFKSITTQTAVGRRVIKLIQNNIAVYSSHTNLDMCDGGVNDALFSVLELTKKEKLMEQNTPLDIAMAGRVGELKTPMTLEEFAEFTKKKLNLQGIRFVGDEATKITKVALCAGAASDKQMFDLAVKNGAEVYITGDICYHDGQKAQDMGLCLIDATHYASENVVFNTLKKYLQDNLKGVETIISGCDGQVFKVI